MRHIDRDLEALKKSILQMGSMVEESMNKAISALVDRRAELAREVISRDPLIDQQELLIEEECLKLLALHNLVATDLRFVVTVMKVDNDLERMGDLSVNIAERALFLAKHPPLAETQQLGRLAEIVQTLVQKSLSALVSLDTSLAREICGADDEVDNLHRSTFSRVQEVMRQDSSTIERALQTLSCSRQLERIADLATNIAEDVVFLVEGVSIKHRYKA